MPEFDFTRATAAQALPAQVLVHGAGSMGKRVAATLRNKGIEPLALLDRHATRGATWEGLPITTPADWREMHGAQCDTVVIGIHNPAHGVGDITAQLQAAGFGPIFTMVDLCNLYPEDFDDCFWLAPRTAYRGCEAQAQALLDMLGDDKSRALVRDVLHMRTQGDYARAPRPEGGQYCPQDLPRWQHALRVVDCGAFTGDTLEAFLAAGYLIEAAICLEPDPANYGALARKVREQGIPAMALPCAVSGQAQVLRFCADGSGSSHIDAQGGVAVQALSLDDAFPDFAPNLVKMDIEGAEPQALAGAARTLARFRPGLAISVYHRFDHLWSIPLQLRENLPDYEFALRAHSHNSFDIVLYAWPRT